MDQTKRTKYNCLNSVMYHDIYKYLVMLLDYSAENQRELPSIGRQRQSNPGPLVESVGNENPLEMVLVAFHVSGKTVFQNWVPAQPKVH